MNKNVLIQLFLLFCLALFNLGFNLSFATEVKVMLEADKNEILIYIRDDVYEDYQQFVAGRDVLTIDDFYGTRIRRDVVDMIIAQQALKLGGFNYHFSYAAGKVNFRNTRLLQTGKLLMSFDSYWQKDAQALKDSVYISNAVIRKGEYVAGIYTSPKNLKVLEIKQLSDLAKFTAVSTPKWRTDWLTLKNLPLKKLIRVDEWLSMAHMVDIGWIDFMLMPFNPTVDQSFSLEKITLIPVNNVAIVLNDSRHFVISKKHPQGKEAIKAINIGLAKLRQQGAIVKAYRQAGFFIDKNKVKILNN
ncbi:MAG: hypothetical protein JKX78_12005 [Alteromonadaceae bacterium]|nr:hypothetical protein [Alteromonadaceae bacterium]